MKTKSCSLTRWLASFTFILALLTVGTSHLWAGDTLVVTNFNTAGDFTWVCPPGVSSVQIECWGGGGGGAGDQQVVNGGGGGAGAAYVKHNSLAVTLGSSYFVRVAAGGTGGTGNNAGLSGSDSWFSNSTPAVVCLAKGGGGGSPYNVSSGQGGTCPSGSIGDVINLGGGGAASVAGSYSGAGGGSGGTGVVSGDNPGNTATDYNVVAAVTGGGPGAGGRVAPASGNANGLTPASGFGGGGGGAYKTSGIGNKVGGDGYRGQVILTYTSTLYTVTYDLNGGTSGDQTDANAYTNNATVTVLNQGSMVNSGSFFTGWNTEPGGGGMVHSAGDTFAITADTTLYAQWEVATAFITTSTYGPLTGLFTTYGTASSADSFTVSGTGITTGILVTAPAAFEVSLDGVNYFTSTNIAGSGTIADTTVYVRLAANAPATFFYGSYVNCTSAGAGAVQVAIDYSSVSQYTLTLTGATAQNKIADGTTTATLIGGTLSSTVNGDTITVGGADFAYATAGTFIPVTVYLAGAAVTNYTLTDPGLYADIYAAGIWVNSSGGTWGTAGNWQNNAVPDGVNVAADFSTLDITADTTVTLNVSRTVGSLIFGDTDTNTPAGWIVSNGGNAANTLTLSGTNTTVNVGVLGAASSVRLNAVVTGTNGLTKTGPGTLVLTNANTYSGGTIVSNGVLCLNNGGDATHSPIGAGELKIFGGTIDNTSAGAVTLQPGNAVTLGKSGFTYGGTQDLDLGTGPVTLTLPNQNQMTTYTLNGTGRTLTMGGTVTETATLGGTEVQVNGPGNTLVLGPLITNPDTSGGNGRSIIWSGSADIIFSGYVNGPVQAAGVLSRFAYTGTGKLTLWGACNYSNTASITTGTLQLGDGTSGHDGTMALVPSLVNNGALVYNRFGSSSYGGVISGSGSVTKLGPGTQTLTGTNTYTGNTTVAGGILVIQQPTLAWTNSTITVTNGGKLQLDFAGGATNPVAALVLDGVSQPPGIYNSSTSPAYLGGAGSLLVLIPTTTTVASDINPSTPGQMVTFTATIAPASGSVVPTGSVQFKTNGVALGAPVVVTAGTAPNATAAISTADLPVGTNVITAEFTSTGVFASSAGTLTGGQAVRVVVVVSHTVSGNQLTLTWPGDQLGWYVQSNSVSLADPNFWFDIPNSELATDLVITITAAETNVFYRLRSPN